MRRAGVAVLCLTQFVDVLGVTSATTAIPAVVDGLGADESAAGPLATTYAMFFGGLLVVGARLGDRFGHRRVLAAGLIGFMAVSLVGGLATSVPQVLAARALQGAAAAVSVPSALRLLIHLTPDDRDRRTALAAWSAAGAAAGAAGFVVGGVLVGAWGWPAVFWVNAPVGAGLLVALLASVPEAPRERDRVPVDALGAALLVLAVMLLVAGASGAERGGAGGAALGLAAGGLVAGVAFAARMRWAAHPLIPVAAVRSVNLRHGTVLSFVNTATTSSAGVLATLVLQDRLGLSALGAGLTLLSTSLLAIAGSAAARPVLERLSPRRAASAGIALIALGDLGLVVAGGTAVGIACASGVLGFGLGAASVAANHLGTTVPGPIAGSASGVLNTGAQLGTALGTAAVVMIAALGSPAWGWGTAAVLAAATAVWAALAGSQAASANPAPERAGGDARAADPA
ncbi:MFS transporter [Cellulomonas pakistanensis]|uniref:MFS transporter n=1 Tax=Cellulomonas pakistanensis TaxID=992287 RepID=A0A919P5W7_9CELL|nr:MFS transporter [Cellulomonas pakistanensis]GIG34919.1 MFS transporter [Cellulomonas pakistanensis]